eukprot:gene10431-21766_t
MQGFTDPSFVANLGNPLLVLSKDSLHAGHALKKVFMEQYRKGGQACLLDKSMIVVMVVLNSDYTKLKSDEMDLKGAYTLIAFNPAVVQYVCIEVDSNLLMFFLSGVFGWSGTPAVFQVVTKTLVYELRLRISGAIVMYVDDLFGIYYRSRVEAEIGFVRQYITCLLGSQSVADEKTEIGQRITFIEYDWDLVSRQVYISKKCLHRAILAFFTGYLDSSFLSVSFSNWLL